MHFFGKVLLGLFWVAAGTTVSAVEFEHPAFAPTGLLTSIPIGHAEFCAALPSECVEPAQIVTSIALDQALWTQLLAINNQVNQEVIPVADQALYLTAEFWAYPEGAGDCEDYVLAKRRALAKVGWPTSAMMIAVVRQQNGEGHAVLMVRTDRGDLVLDNLSSEILVWNQSPYQFLKRQSQAHAGRWVDILDERFPTRVATDFGTVLGATHQQGLPPAYSSTAARK